MALSDLIWRKGPPSGGYAYDLYIYVCQAEYRIWEAWRWLCGHREPPEDYSYETEYDPAVEEEHARLQEEFRQALSKK